MSKPLRIDFRNMSAPFGADDEIRDCLAALRQLFNRIIAVSVVVEKRHRHHHRGNLYYIVIELIVADRVITVLRDPPYDSVHENLRVAIRDAFRGAQAKLHLAVDWAAGEIVANTLTRDNVDVTTVDRIRAEQKHARPRRLSIE